MTDSFADPISLADLGTAVGSLALQLVIAVWVFVVGSSIGSFLNVVIFRLPAKISLLRPPSRCPRCESPIRLKHNIPVFGWAMLGGRCADCGAPIPLRYPLVEAATGILFVLLLMLDIGSGGYHLPAESSWIIPQTGWGLWLFRPELGWLLAHHVVLGCLLISATMITKDGHAIPRTLSLTGVGILLLIGLFAPTLPPVPYSAVVGKSLPEPTLGIRLLTMFFGATMGLLVGALLCVTRHQVGSGNWLRPAIWIGLWSGLVMGWQAMIPAGLLTGFFVCFGGQLIGRKRERFSEWPLTGWFALAVLVHLAFWSFLASPTPVLLAFHTYLLILLCVMIRWIEQQMFGPLAPQTAPYRSDSDSSAIDTPSSSVSVTEPTEPVTDRDSTPPN